MRKRKSTTNAPCNDCLLEIAPNGTLRFLWDDNLAPFLHLGEASLQRASHVEPSGSAWVADMTHVGGSVLGPFVLRKEALAAERNWLQLHGLGRRVNSSTLQNTT